MSSQITHVTTTPETFYFKMADANGNIMKIKRRRINACKTKKNKTEIL